MSAGGYAQAGTQTSASARAEARGQEKQVVPNVPTK